MRRHIWTVITALVVLGVAIAAFGQRGAAPTQAPQAATVSKPPLLFFRETWNRRPPGTKDNDDIPIAQSFVNNPNLDLKLYGHAREIIMPVQGEAAPPDTGPLTYAWTGVVEGNWILTLKDRNNFVDLSGSKIRWRTRQRGFHALRPVIRLADGTMLAGDYAEPTSDYWRETEFYLSDVPRWRVLDPDLAVESRDSAWRTKVDFSRVDEVGFTDLSRGAGHGTGGSSAVDWIEVYGKAIKRGTSQ